MEDPHGCRDTDCIDLQEGITAEFNGELLVAIHIEDAIKSISNGTDYVEDNKTLPAEIGPENSLIPPLTGLQTAVFISKVLMYMLILLSVLWVDDRTQYWAKLAILAYLLISLWNIQKTYDTYSMKFFFEAMVNIALNNIDLIWVLLFNDLAIPLWFLPSCYVYDFIFRQYYLYDELDDFTYLVNFFLCLTVYSIYSKENLLTPLIFTGFIYLCRLADIWIIQRLTLQFDPSSVVSIQATNLWSADSAHLLLPWVRKSPMRSFKKEMKLVRKTVKRNQGRYQ